MSDNPLDADKIRQYVDQNFKKARRTQHLILWGTNFCFFVVLSLIAWLIVLGKPPVSDQTMAALTLVSAGWMVGLIMHSIALYTESEAGQRQIRQQLALKAMQEALGQTALDAPEAQEKPKRAQVVELSDDGELIPVEETEARSNQKEQSKS